MDPVVSISKSEWEAFLTENSKLVQKYELLLSQLEVPRTKITGLQERTAQQVTKSGDALRQVKNILDKLCEETERQLLESE
jgi:hypothetical protein